MKAVVTHRYGPPEVLRIDQVDRPVVRDNDVLIRVQAAEVTKSDCEMRSFRFPVKWFALPLRLAMGIRKPKRPVLGGYFAGVVEAVGAKVSRFSPGDQLFGCARLRLGAHAEYICLPDTFTLVAKPHNATFEQSAAVPLGGLNALHFLRKAQFRAGERVLINGAGGSIGAYAVQIAKAMGAKVTAVDAACKKQMLQELGADHFIDYTQADFTQNGLTYDVIFSMVANTSYAASMQSLAPKGRYLLANPRLSDMLRSVFTSLFSQKRATFSFAGEKAEELRTLKEMIESGEIQPVVDRVYPMEQATKAHRRVESETRLGPVVLSMNS